jgi:hypothetical protein
VQAASFAIRQSETILARSCEAGRGVVIFFHGLFSTVCNEFGTNARKQTQSSFAENTYENRVFTNVCKTAQTTFLKFRISGHIAIPCQEIIGLTP